LNKVYYKIVLTVQIVSTIFFLCGIIDNSMNKNLNIDYKKKE